MIRAAWAVALLSTGCYAVHEPGEMPGPDPGAERPTCGEGQTCDSAPGEGEHVCFYRDGDRTTPMAEAIYRFEVTSLGEAWRVSLILAESFVDNTWGERSSSGYRDRGHTFRDLVRSDHAQIAFSDSDGHGRVEIRIDYLSESADVASGYRSLGVWGGDGRIVSGFGSGVLFATSSLDDNLNLHGCAIDQTSSPAPGACEGWEPRVIYTVWLSPETFDPSGFGAPSLDHIHASPSRTTNTIEVTKAPCPD
jgi:hypothetical protein